MFKLFYIILFIILAPEDGEAKRLRIIGGLVVPRRSQFAFFVQLQLIFYNGTTPLGMTCGSTLIHPQWILSAAHCFYDFKDQIQQLVRERNLITYAGTNIRYGKNANKNHINKVFIHPDVVLKSDAEGNLLQSAYDVAVARLFKKYTLDEYIQLALLPKPRKISDIRTSRCKNGTIVGVGLETQDDSGTKESFPKYVKYTTAISKTRYELEAKVQKPLVPTVFYTESEYLNNHTLSGDSGGPFVCHYGNEDIVVYGVLSSGIVNTDTATKYETNIDVFEEVDKHVDFILNLVKGASIYSKSKITKFPRHQKHTSIASIDTNEPPFYYILLSLICVIKNMI